MESFLESHESLTQKLQVKLFASLVDFDFFAAIERHYACTVNRPHVIRNIVDDSGLFINAKQSRLRNQ